MDKLLAIQAELKAPKDLKNTFGGYHYRSCASILEALKPLLFKHSLVLTLDDDIVSIGNRIYVKALATLSDNGKPVVQVCAFAREEETKKGMDASQITGAASSYARKYALNGLFLIDDTKDSDHTNGMSEERQKPQRQSESEELAIKAALAKAKYNTEMTPTTSALGRMAPKEDKTPSEAIIEPLTEPVGLVARGIVIAHYPPKGKGPHSFKVDGFEDYLKTFDELVAETLMEHKIAEDVIEVSYEMITKGAYTNAMITGITEIN